MFFTYSPDYHLILISNTNSTEFDVKILSFTLAITILVVPKPSKSIDTFGRESE